MNIDFRLDAFRFRRYESFPFNYDFAANVCSFTRALSHGRMSAFWRVDFSPKVTTWKHLLQDKTRVLALPEFPKHGGRGTTRKTDPGLPEQGKE
jgi:hypothetical protein